MSAHTKTRQVQRHLGALQCHFTWGLCTNPSLLLHRRDKLLDICPDESNPWRGQIYNLLGFLQTRLGHYDEALSLFSSASEALRGPELLVNYSDLAWLYDERGEPAQSKEYLRRVEELKRDQLLPEVYAETGLDSDGILQKLRLCCRVEWRSAQVLALFYVKKKKGSEFLEQLRHTSERDPENLPLRAGYLQQCARSGQEVGPEAKALAAKVLLCPDRMHRHMEPLLHLYRSAVSVHAAVDLATKALDKRPDSRFLKACLAMCHKWRIHQREAMSQELIDCTVVLLHEVISLYPDSCFRMEIDLANAYAQSNHGLTDAKLLYSELLRRDLEPTSKQILYNNYAKFLHFELNDAHMSTQYHLRAAKIPVKSYCRSNSIEIYRRSRTGRERPGAARSGQRLPDREECPTEDARGTSFIL
uniref:Interferon-induced protein with tetratricopeptide repeats 1-like n=1 Tax=Neogobius melanostomus TaxID=47308 RepID=A0A8C6TBG7_9GOBI